MAANKDLLRYFQSNLPLPDELVPSWQSCRDDLSQSISAKDSEIRELKRQLELREKEMVALCEKKLLVTSFRSAVRQLPAELIARIMRYALQLHRSPLGREGRFAFMTLRSVSSRWRETALTTPYLWRSLEVDFSEDDYPDSTGTRGPPTSAIRKMKSWFARGGQGCHVHLSIQDAMWFPARDLAGYLPSLLNNQSQFRPCTLEVGPGILRSDRDIQSLYTISASNTGMRSLILTSFTSAFLHNSSPTSENGGDDTRQVPLSSLSTSFPQMECLSLKGDLHTLNDLVHPTLRSLVLQTIGSQVLLSGFSRPFHHLPALEELVLTSLAISNDIKFAPVQLPSLKRLTLVIERTLIEIVPIFTCPRLQWMHLTGRNSGISELTSPLAEELESLVKRSQARYFTLRVTDRDLKRSLPALLSPSLPIHCLDVASADWLANMQGSTSLREAHNFLPSSLRDIYIREEPIRHTSSAFGQQSSFLDHLHPFKSFLSMARSQDSGATSWGIFGCTAASRTVLTGLPDRSGDINTQTIDVYVPGMEEKEVDSLNSNVRWDGGANLCFHRATEEWIEERLYLENPAVCDGYEMIVEGFAPPRD